MTSGETAVTELIQLPLNENNNLRYLNYNAKEKVVVLCITRTRWILNSIDVDKNQD